MAPVCGGEDSEVSRAVDWADGDVPDRAKREAAGGFTSVRVYLLGLSGGFDKRH